MSTRTLPALNFASWTKRLLLALLITWDQRVAPLEDARTLGKALRGPLGEFWRYRLGDYRIICDIHDEKLRVLVVRVGNRKDVYR